MFMNKEKLDKKKIKLNIKKEFLLDSRNNIMETLWAKG